MYLLRLSNIAQFLSHERNLANALQYLGMNSCPSGAICRVYLVRINSDLSLRHLSSFGFSEDAIEMRRNANILQEQTLLRAINDKVLAIAPAKNFIDAPSNEASWKTDIYLPLLPNFAAIFTTQGEISDNEDSYKYFDTLRAIISLYVHLVDELETYVSPRYQKSKSPARGEKLSERQEVILRMVKEGMTNLEIAEELGYSESLIRQETIAIYQKLGVDGRRDLNKSQATQR